MPFNVSRRLRTTKPSGDVGLNWDNPLTRGLVVLQVPSISSSNLVPGDLKTAGPNANSGAGKYGSGSTFQGVFSTSPALASTNFSALSIFKTPTTINSIDCVFGRGPSSPNNTGFGFNASHTNASYAGALYAGGSYTVIGKPTGGALAVNTDYVIGLTYDGTNGRGFNNGRLTVGPTAVGSINTTARFSVNQDTSGASPCVAQIYVMAVWNRALSDADMASISDNPWQLFEAEEDFGYYAAAAGGGTTISGALGTAVASGFTGTVNANRTIAGALGTASASGFTGNVNANRTVSGALGTAVASGFTGTVENSTDTTINGNLGVAVASGFKGNVSANRAIVGALGTAVASGFTGTVVNDSGVTITGNLGTAVASGFTGGVTWNRYIAGLLGTAHASGFTGGVANGSPVVAGGGGWLPQTRRKSRKQIYEERVKLGILPPPVIKAAAKVAAVAQTVEEFKEERPKYEEMFLKAIKKTEWLPDYTRAIQAQLAIMEAEEEELLLLL